MKIYFSKYSKISGTSYDEVAPIARKVTNIIKRRTKRQPYVKSKYFRGDKVFISVFWEHLSQKHRGEKAQRLKFYLCAIDLLRNSMHSPDTIFSSEDKNILLHRFSGKTKEGDIFYVQVKHDKRSGRKDFMSVFPENNSKK